MINELAACRAKELFIVLDDHRWLEPGSPAYAMVGCQIDRIPAYILVICSRIRLLLASLPKWRPKQDSFEFNQSDLAFRLERMIPLFIVVCLLRLFVVSAREFLCGLFDFNHLVDIVRPKWIYCISISDEN